MNERGAPLLLMNLSNSVFCAKALRRKPFAIRCRDPLASAAFERFRAQPTVRVPVLHGSLSVLDRNTRLLLPVEGGSKLLRFFAQRRGAAAIRNCYSEACQ